MKKSRPKFRIWDAEISPPQMIYLESNQPYKITLGGSVVYMDDVYVNNCDLMQFTGLIDKNGKEIYEGDIINALHPSNKMALYGQVSFKNGCFKFDYINDPWNLFVMKEIEVIGNIYENPELLK